MRVHVVIVNFRTARCCVECLRSLENEIKRGPEIAVTVVDNFSDDGSVETISQAVESYGWQWVSVLARSENGGFALGNNDAIRLALNQSNPPDYVLLLNPDTVVRPGAIVELLDFMECHPKAGIAGSRLEDPDGAPQRSAFLFPSVWSELNDGIHLRIVEKLIPRSQLAPPAQDQPHKSDWVAGASFMIRRQMLEQIGLLDEDYFMYYEEVDFCLRAKRAGWECWYVPESRVVHFVGQASKINNPQMQPKRRPAYWFESRHRFFRKNYGVLTSVVADLLFATGYLIFRLRRLITFTPVQEPPWFFWDFLRFCTIRRGTTT